MLEVVFKLLKETPDLPFHGLAKDCRQLSVMRRPGPAGFLLMCWLVPVDICHGCPV